MGDLARFLVALTLALTATVSQADILKVNYVFNSEGNGAGTIDAFNPALGTLTNVSFYLTADHRVSYDTWSTCELGDWGQGPPPSCWVYHALGGHFIGPTSSGWGTDNNWGPDPATQLGDLYRGYWAEYNPFYNGTELAHYYQENQALVWHSEMYDVPGPGYWTTDVTITLEVTYTYNPIDADGDGVPDIWDAYPNISLGGRLDTDNDGIPNDCDATCIGLGMTADTDDDNDTILDGSDNCPLEANTDQVNTDGMSDGGDVCDGDDDDDYICDGADAIEGVCLAGPDNCRKISNNSQLDSNNDGCGDACITGGGCTAPVCVND